MIIQPAMGIKLKQLSAHKYVPFGYSAHVTKLRKFIFDCIQGLNGFPRQKVSAH